MIIYRDQGNSLAWVTWEIKGAKNVVPMRKEDRHKKQQTRGEKRSKRRYDCRSCNNNLSNKKLQINLKQVLEFSEGMGSNCIKAWIFLFTGGGGG